MTRSIFDGIPCDHRAGSLGCRRHESREQRVGSDPRTLGLVGGLDDAVGLMGDRLGEMLSVSPKLPSIVTGVMDRLSAGRSTCRRPKIYRTIGTPPERTLRA
jgi:hypothetical protein